MERKINKIRQKLRKNRSKFLYNRGKYNISQDNVLGILIEIINCFKFFLRIIFLYRDINAYIIAKILKLFDIFFSFLPGEKTEATVIIFKYKFAIK